MNGRNKSQKITIDDLKQMVINQDETVWNVKQLASVIGASEEAVRKRIKRNVIPAHKEGRSWYILKSEYISNLRNK